jgi:hypothetical protein
VGGLQLTAHHRTLSAVLELNGEEDADCAALADRRAAAPHHLILPVHVVLVRWGEHQDLLLC